MGEQNNTIISLEDAAVQFNIPVETLEWVIQDHKEQEARGVRLSLHAKVAVIKACSAIVLIVLLAFLVIAKHFRQRFHTFRTPPS